MLVILKLVILGTATDGKWESHIELPTTRAQEVTAFVLSHCSTECDSN